MKPKMLIAIVLFAVVGYFIFTGKQHEAQRTDAMPSVASDLGLEYSRSASAASLSPTRFPLFTRGEDVTVSNVMRGSADNGKLSVFDVSYREVRPNNEIAGNEDPGRLDQTAVLIASGTALPDFVLRPTNVIESWVKQRVGEGVALVKDKAGDRIELAQDKLSQLTDQMRGYTSRIDPRVAGTLGDIGGFIDAKVLTDINFDANSGFSDKYLLTGSDEVAIRQAFSPAVMDHLASMSPPVSVESKGGELLAYRGGELMSTDGMNGFIGQVKTLQALLSQK